MGHHHQNNTGSGFLQSKTELCLPKDEFFPYSPSGQSQFFSKSRAVFALEVFENSLGLLEVSGAMLTRVSRMTIVVTMTDATAAKKLLVQSPRCCHWQQQGLCK